MESEDFRRREIFYLVLLIFLFAFVAYQQTRLNGLKEGINEPKPKAGNFSLLSNEISELSVDEFLKKRESFTISYKDMRIEIENYLGNYDGYYGVYFEDLTTGSWIGINERENEFVPASLLKLPSLVATLKKVELGEISLEDKVKLVKGDIDSRSGELWKKGAGYEVTIEELLVYLIQQSDNTAANTLKNQVLNVEELIEAQYAMGLPAPEDGEEQKMSPKSYSNILRSLYLSSYLRRTFSEKALTIMLHTDFNSGIPAGVSGDVRIAHKVGFLQNGGYYHDCGIVYYEQPYLLCIMSANSTKEESDEVISGVSKIVFDYHENKKI